MRPISPLSILVAMTLLAGSPLKGEDAGQKRVVVALVSFASGAETAEQWSSSFRSELSLRLGKVKALRIRGQGYGRRKIGLGPTVAPSKEQAIEIGLLVEAQRVLRGTVTRHPTGWKVAAALLNPATGEEETIEATGEDFWTVRDRTVERVLERLGVSVREDEQEEVLKRWTKSAEALRLSSEAYRVSLKDGPLEEVEALLRKAVEADGKSSELWEYLAWCYRSREKDDKAAEAVRRALELDPENTGALAEQAIQGSGPDVEKTLGKILELDQEHVHALQMMANLCLQQEDRVEEGLALLRRAKRLDPMDAGIRAAEAVALVRQGKRTEAETALREAVRLAVGEDSPIGDHYQIAEAAGVMGKTSLTLASLRKVAALARIRGQLPSAMKKVEEGIAKLEERMKTVPIDAEVPRTYTPQELQAAFAELLNKEELERIENPLEVTPRMVEWARTVVGDAEGERATAKALFEVMDSRLDLFQRGGARTAKEVFALWDEPGSLFSCQEYAKLYVGLARQLGLEAFFVEVQRDHENDLVYHACAAVRADGEWILADPTYDWFGIPHRNFILLDDLQAIALHYSQSRNEAGRFDGFGGGSLAERRLALKLFPESAYVRVTLAAKLLADGEIERAREELDRADHLAPGRWDVRMFRGMVAAEEKDLAKAQEFMEEALELNPRSADAHGNLGMVLARRGELAEARAHYREALSCRPSPAWEQDLLQQIALINDQIGTSEDSPVGRALQMWKEGDVEGAAREFEEALRQDPDVVVHHVRLGQCLSTLGRYDDAESHLRRAIELEPESAYASRILMAHLFGTNQFERCRALVEETLESHPADGFFLSMHGNLLMMAEEPEAALHAFRKALAAGNLTSPLSLASLLAYSGRFEESAERMELATAAGISGAKLLLSATDTWRMLGRNQEASQCLNQLKTQAVAFEILKLNEETGNIIQQMERGLALSLAREEKILQRLRDNEDAGLAFPAGVEMTESLTTPLRTGVFESELEPCFRDRRDEVLRELEEREVTTITLPKGEGAREIAGKIRDRLGKGATPADAADEFVRAEKATVQKREWSARDGLHESMQEPVFATPSGGVSEVIDGGSFLAISVVHATRPGQGGTLEDEHVKEAVRTVLVRDRLVRWNERYLAHLRERIRKERKNQQ